jgi:hypothetical protein
MPLRLSLAAFALLSAASTALAAPANHSFAPENDLWKEDGMFEKENMSRAEFDMVIDAAYTIYKPITSRWFRKLNINRNWDDPTVNANCSNIIGHININMYGGLARRPEVSRDGFALVLCHELGHALGGAPYANPLFRLSAEGNADYWGAGNCMNQMLRIIPADGDVVASEFMQKRCTENHAENSEDYTLCVRQLAAAQSLGTMLATLSKEPAPEFSTPDLLIVDKTNVSYPSTQCRLDSYVRGTFGEPRPLCWYKP